MPAEFAPWSRNGNGEAIYTDPGEDPIAPSAFNPVVRTHSASLAGGLLVIQRLAESVGHPRRPANTTTAGSAIYAGQERRGRGHRKQEPPAWQERIKP